MSLRSDWLELFRALGRAATELVSAELAALRDDFGRAGRDAGIALALLGAAGFVAFWTLGTLIAFSIALMARWMPVWSAALTVSGVLVLVNALLIWLGLRRFRSLEPPATMVQRRWEDHQQWWNESVVGDERLALDRSVQSLGEPNEPIE